jgi:hypothetical protein
MPDKTANNCFDYAAIPTRNRRAEASDYSTIWSRLYRIWIIVHTKNGPIGKKGGKLFDLRRMADAWRPRHAQVLSRPNTRVCLTLKYLKLLDLVARFFGSNPFTPRCLQFLPNARLSFNKMYLGLSTRSARVN